MKKIEGLGALGVLRFKYIQGNIRTGTDLQLCAFLVHVWCFLTVDAIMLYFTRSYYIFLIFPLSQQC